jgi:hypothetical protein
MHALLYTNAVSIDLARQHPDPVEREARRELVDLLTPISKAWCTDLGVDLASVGLQVHGGMGYVEETGVAQYLRDSRIAPIYEGTNGIQGIDLVLRKVPMRGGGVVADLLAQMEALGPELEAAGEELVGIGPALAGGVSALREATDWIPSRGPAEPNDALAGATPYLRLARPGHRRLADGKVRACCVPAAAHRERR